MKFCSKVNIFEISNIKNWGYLSTFLNNEKFDIE